MEEVTAPSGRSAPPPPVAAERSAVDRAMSGLFGRDAVYLAVWAVQLMVGALVTPFVTRLMTKQQFGVLASVSAVMQVLFVLGGAGLATALQRQHARGADREARQLLSVALLIAICITALAFITGPLWSAAIGFGGFGMVQQLAVLWAGTGAVTNCSLALLRSQDRLLRFGLVSLIQSVVAEVLSLVLVAALPTRPAYHFVLGQFAAQLGAMLLGLAFALPALPRLRDLPLIRQTLRFSLPLVPALLSTFVLNASDRLVLHRLLGGGPTGGYQVAYNIGSMPILLLGVLSVVWLPRLFELTSNAAVVLAASRDAINRLLPAIVLGMAVGGPVMMRLWAPAKYHPDALRLTLALVVITVIPFAAGEAATRSLMVGGRTTAVAISNILAAALNLALNIVVDPHFGLVGAASATLVSYTLLWLVLRSMSQRSSRIPPSPRRLLTALATAAVLAVASTVLPVGGWFILLRSMVAVLTVAHLLYTLRAVQQQHRTDADNPAGPHPAGPHPAGPDPAGPDSAGQDLAAPRR